MPGDRLVLAAAVAVAALLVWTLSQVVLLAFASIFLAVAFTAIADQICKLKVVGREGALAIVLVLVFGTMLFTVLLGATIATDVGRIFGTISEGTMRLREQLSSMPWLQSAIDGAGSTGQAIFGDGLAPRAFGFLRSVAGGLISVFAVVAGAIYISFSAPQYRAGVLSLVPPDWRDRADEFLSVADQTLRLWLLSQLILMLSIGLLVAVTLWLLGVPSAFELGVFAGIVEFIPFFGPVVAGAAAVLVALSIDLDLAGWTLLSFVAIQQIEGQILAPLVQEKAAALPAAVGIYGIVAFGALFGLIGIMVGAPLVVLIIVAVKFFYLDSASAPTGAD